MSKPYLEIISCNGQASIQDLGRPNAQHLGFSVSGAADEFAFLTANNLIAQQQNIAHTQHTQSACAAIEITLGQIAFKAHSACTIAITGADCQATINNVLVSNWQSCTLKAGDILDFSMPKVGLHTYLAVLGGFTGEISQQPWLGSFSQTKNEMALGFTGEQITTGSKLYFKRQSKDQTQVVPKASSFDTSQLRNRPTPATQFYARDKLTLRFIASTIFSKMSVAQQAQFLATEYVISADSNRMGYRLNTVQQARSTSEQKILPEILRTQCSLSMPVTYGMIQFPANEQPIVLMKERQTMGGYPVLGTVMQTDLFRLSQMRPGEKVNFTLISVKQAQQQLTAFQNKLLHSANIKSNTLSRGSMDID